MQKRLSVARALLTAPPVLLVDEATHDLEPEGASDVRDLVAKLARDGTAVVWATQRIDEIRGFADQVTLLGGGEVRFSGSVPALIATTDARSFVLQLRHNGFGDATRRATSSSTAPTAPTASPSWVSRSSASPSPASAGQGAEELIRGIDRVSPFARPPQLHHR